MISLLLVPEVADLEKIKGVVGLGWSQLASEYR